jgi:hypothetical protein
MPRLSYFGALLGIAALLSAPICAQTSAPSNAQNSARVQHVEVRGSGDNLEVEIQTSGPSVAPDTQAIVGPDRIVVDFPGALPAAELRALKVNRGVLKSIRSGLFFSNPPITRVVLDLTEPQSYQISTAKNSIIVKLGPAVAAAGNTSQMPAVGKARLQNASLATDTRVASARVSPAVSSAVTNVVTHMTPSAPPAVSEAQAPPPPPPPPVTVTFENGMLRIHAEKATLAQVLFEVQRQTQAEIAIPAGAEQEQVAAELGPAPARDVLGSLLNGSSYNFIFVGNEAKLERVILTRRDPSIF